MHEKILDQVRKLLAIADSTPYPGEAETALAKANKLLLRHNLSLADVGPAEDRSWTEQIAIEASRLGPGDDIIAVLLDDHFLVKVIHRWRYAEKRRVTRLAVFGSPENVAVAIYVFGFLRSTLRSLWLAYARRTGSRERRAYYSGACDGFGEKLAAERAEFVQDAGNRTGLIRLGKALTDAFQQQNPDCHRRTVRVRGSAEAFEAGLSDGARISLAKPLPAPELPKRIGAR